MFWLAVAAFVGSTEGGLIAGLLPSIGEEMKVTAGQTGQVVLGYSLAYAIGTPILSVLLGGVGRRRVLAGGQFTLAVCALLIAVSPFFLWLVGARTLLAIGAGLFTATALSTAAMIAAPGQRGRALQVVSMGQSLAVLLGVPVGAYVATQFSWRLDYFAISAASFAAALVLYLRLPKGMLGDQQSLRERMRVFGNRGVPPALATTLLFMVAAYPPLVFIGPVMSGAAISHELLPFPLLANGIGAVLASMTAGRVADRLGNRVTVVLSTLVMIIALAVLVPLPHLPIELRAPTLFVDLRRAGLCRLGLLDRPLQRDGASGAQFGAGGDLVRSHRAQPGRGRCGGGRRGDRGWLGAKSCGGGVRASGGRSAGGRAADADTGGGDLETPRRLSNDIAGYRRIGHG